MILELSINISRFCFAGLSEEFSNLENTPSHVNTPRNGTEWVELFVTEMSNATTVDDARSRAMNMLESLEKSIHERFGCEGAQGFHKVGCSVWFIDHS